ncbi:MAG TPA: hypothetical protein VM184_05990 [Gaiellaceae bacterium]|nr:hypothetical protein [Gaiellaceae bacterium]
MRRRVAAFALAAVVLAVALVAIGRLEQRRGLERHQHELLAVFAASGGRIDSRTVSAFRPGPPRCLFYAAGEEPYALQLCFDEEGRLVESADRRRAGRPSYATVARTPERAPVRVSPAELNALFELLQDHSGGAGGD